MYITKTSFLFKKLKTVHIALVMALNIGIDPPDEAKPSPCCRTECWCDPNCLPLDKDAASEIIAKQLQEQVIIQFILFYLFFFLFY